MSNDFFNNHPLIGSVLYFNHDGDMSLDEAGAMGAFGAMYASEAMRTSREAGRDAGGSRWEDDDDDEYALYGSSKHGKSGSRKRLPLRRR